MTPIPDPCPAFRENAPLRWERLTVDELVTERRSMEQVLREAHGKYLSTEIYSEIPGMREARSEYREIVAEIRRELAENPYLRSIEPNVVILY